MEYLHNPIAETKEQEMNSSYDQHILVLCFNVYVCFPCALVQTRVSRIKTA